MGYVLALLCYLYNEYITYHETVREDENTPLTENHGDR